MSYSLPLPRVLSVAWVCACILRVRGRVYGSVGEDFRQALAGQVNPALLQPGEDLRVNERIPAGPTLGEVGKPCCQGGAHRPEPVQEERVFRAKGALELLAQPDSQRWGTTARGDGNGQGSLTHDG